MTTLFDQHFAYVILAEIDVGEGQKKPVGFSLVRCLKLEETTNGTSTTMRIRRGRHAPVSYTHLTLPTNREV